MNVIEGSFAAQGKKFAIVVSRFNSFIVESLLEGAIDALKRHGQVADADITVIRVPGAYELPVAAAVGQLGPKHRVPLPQLMRLISSACLQ